jgi:hypothetical protein
MWDGSDQRVRWVIAAAASVAVGHAARGDHNSRIPVTAGAKQEVAGAGYSQG